MIQFIKHRVNSIDELKNVQPAWGVEVDVRSIVDCPGAFHLSHDPWKKGDDFRRWLAAFKAQKISGPLIINTKEDGLEETLVDLLLSEGIENYFFLDTVLPTLVRWVQKKQHQKFAVRLSSYEGIENVLPFEGAVEWVWVDCFNGVPLPEKTLKLLEGRFKLCLVSPELQQKPVEAIPSFASLARRCDAVCTKRPDLWAGL